MSRTNDSTENGMPLPLGRWQQLALALGGVLGSGWLVAIPGTFGMSAGEAVLAWLLGAAALGLIATVMIKLAQADPRPGGLAWWPTDTSGQVVGTIVNAGLFVVYAGNPPAGSAAAVIGLERAFAASCAPTGSCTGHLGLIRTDAAEPAHLTTAGFLVALAIMTVLFAVHLIGLKLVLRLNIALSTLKVILLVLLIAAAFAMHFQIFAADWIQHPDVPLSPLAAALTTGGIVFAFNGFQSPVDHGGKKGSRHVGFAIYGALIIATVLYVALQLAFTTGVETRAPGPQAHSLPWALVVSVTVLAPLMNALLFISLAAIVLRTSARQRVLRFPSYDMRDAIPVFVAVYLFGVVCMFLTLDTWSSIAESKSVIYAFVYSFAAVSYAAYRRSSAEPGRYPHSLRVLGPLSFVVGTLIAYYSGFSTLLWAYVLVAAVASLMFLSRWGRPNTRLSERLRRARWFLGYLAVLFVLSGIHFLITALSAGDHSTTSEILRGIVAAPADDARENPIVQHGLAAVAAVAALICYEMGVRESTRYIKTRTRR